MFVEGTMNWVQMILLMLPNSMIVVELKTLKLKVVELLTMFLMMIHDNVFMTNHKMEPCGIMRQAWLT
jgi:hypothetical protein